MIFSLDIAIIVGLLIIFGVYCFYFGRNSATTLILSLYIGLLFYTKAPFIEKLLIFKNSPLELSLYILGIYIIFVVLTYLLIKKHIHSLSSDLNAFKSVIFGLAITFFVISIGHLILQTDLIHNFGPKIESIIDTIGPFYTLLAPLLILLLV
jgi:hypothetical protein